MKKLLLICLLLPALAYSFTYKNNPQTGKQDLVTTSVSDLTDISTGYVPAVTFSNYTSNDRLTTTAASATYTTKTTFASYTSIDRMKTDYSNAGTAPTWNQNTTGSAAKLTTPRAINGVDFDGTAPITINAVDSTARALLAGSQSQAFSTSALTVVGNPLIYSADIAMTDKTTTGSINIKSDVVGYGSTQRGYGPTITFSQDNNYFSGGGYHTNVVSAIKGFVDTDTNTAAYGGMDFYTNDGTILNKVLTLKSDKTVSVNGGTNTVYYCNGGANTGLLGRGNSGPCSGGAWVATSLKLD